jgi:hypothetical protein
MDTNTDGCLTEGHLMLFGTIVHWMARYEVLIQRIIAHVTGSQSSDVMLLTRDLTLGEKRLALLNLLRHRTVPHDQVDAIYGYLRIPETFRALSDDILHSTWAAGRSSSSIQPDWILRPKPTVKPVHGGAEGRAEDFQEDYDDQVEYSLDELAETAKTLRENYRLFFAYCRSIGMVGAGGEETG